MNGGLKSVCFLMMAMKTTLSPKGIFAQAQRPDSILPS